MVKIKLPVLWSDSAKFQLRNIYDYIKVDSISAAKKVKKNILVSTRQLSEFPFLYEKDSLKDNNDGEYRAYTVYNYRITYKITQENIQILRVRHTSLEPLFY